MNGIIYLPRQLVRTASGIQIGLGLLIWIGVWNALSLVYMLSGFVLILSLWFLSVVAAVAGVNPYRVGLSIIWGITILILGFTLVGLIPGPTKLVIQITNVLLGLGAIIQAEDLVKMILKR